MLSRTTTVRKVHVHKDSISSSVRLLRTNQVSGDPEAQLLPGVFFALRSGLERLVAAWAGLGVAVACFKRTAPRFEARCNESAWRKRRAAEAMYKWRSRENRSSLQPAIPEALDQNKNLAR